MGAPSRSGRAESHLEAAASATEPATSFRIIIQGRNVSVTPAIKQHLESKLISAVSSFEAVIREVRGEHVALHASQPVYNNRLTSRSRCTEATPPRAHATRSQR